MTKVHEALMFRSTIASTVCCVALVAPSLGSAAPISQGPRPLTLLRDPFVGDPVPKPGREPQQSLAPETGIVGLQVHQGFATGYSVRSAVSVSAILVGRSPMVLANDGARVRIVGIGGLLAGSRIVAIKNHRVYLRDGRTLGLGGGLR